MYPSNTILYATAIKYLQISCLQLIIFLPTPLQEHNLKLSLSSNLLEILSYEKHMRLHGMCKTSTRIFMCMHKQPDGTGLVASVYVIVVIVFDETSSPFLIPTCEPLESCAKRNQMRFNEAGN
ncbi:hypothetical protein GQX74_015388 [Glossina fuscipes]|nr:hypothetical protein GQX74_015388 [Glossina fuscipes]